MICSPVYTQKGDERMKVPPKAGLSGAVVGGAVAGGVMGGPLGILVGGVIGGVGSAIGQAGFKKAAEAWKNRKDSK